MDSYQVRTYAMKTIKNLTKRIHAPVKLLPLGAILFVLFQFPSEPALPISADHVRASEPETVIAEAFFGSEAPFEEARAIIEDQMQFVSTRKAYPASLAVIQKHENTIRTQAENQNVPQEVAIGVGLLENGGSETAKSPAGALGVFQLMPGTARNLGLTVNSQEDERKNPEKNIKAGISYLAKNYERFGDWGLSTWAYHAGEGNVTKALKLYAKANHNVDLKGIEDFPAIRRYVEEYDITIHELLSDPEVQKFTEKLNDDSSGYPYKVIATAALYKKDNKTHSHRD